MKIINQSVKLIDNLSYEEILAKIEKCGRVCYQSPSKGNPEQFIKMLINRGHESVLEHVSLTFDIITNRNISHQIVRHRIASYSQESTRYVNYAELEFIPTSNNYNSDYLEYSESMYVNSTENPEVKRDLLPGCVKTQLIMTMNMRELRHFLKLRLSKAAHPQIRELANMINDILKEKYPVFAII